MMRTGGGLPEEGFDLRNYFFYCLLLRNDGDVVRWQGEEGDRTDRGNEIPPLFLQNSADGDGHSCFASNNSTGSRIMLKRTSQESWNIILYCIDKRVPEIRFTQHHYHHRLAHHSFLLSLY